MFKTLQYYLIVILRFNLQNKGTKVRQY